MQHMFPRERARLGTQEMSSSIAPLPDWHALLAAFCGHLGDRTEDHPVVRYARTLAELHLRRPDEPAHVAEIDCRRAELVAKIDRWISERLTPPHTRRPLAESPGNAIDRMAAAQVHANHLLHTATDITDGRVHAAWYRLATLADAWTDQVAQLLHGHRLPPCCHGVNAATRSCRCGQQRSAG
jgi:hypothetical protein